MLLMFYRNAYIDILDKKKYWKCQYFGIVKFDLCLNKRHETEDINHPASNTIHYRSECI